MSSERTVVTKYGIRVRSSHPGINEATLSALEKRLGRSLPVQYREFLLVCNGGQPDRREFSFSEQGGPLTNSGVRYFLGVAEGQLDDLERKHGLMEGRIPAELLAIAADPGGNLVCIGLEGDAYGRVFFWDHERESDDQDWSSVDPIADSFDEFMNGLKLT